MEWEGWPKRHVVDIEHLVTLQNESDKQFLVCHGIWVHTLGDRSPAQRELHIHAIDRPLLPGNGFRLVHGLLERRGPLVYKGGCRR
jgi:hypothetical protein